MSDQNKVILTKANAAILAKDHEKFLSYCTDDTRWHFLGDKTLEGKDAVRHWLDETYIEPPTLKVDNLIADGDYLAAYGEITVKNKEGAVTSSSYCDVWRFHGGKLAELKAYVVEKKAEEPDQSKLGAPKLETRPEQAYVGRRVVMSMNQFDDSVPALMQELTQWMDDHGVKAAGSCFLRYHVIDMPDRLDVEVAFPVGELPETEGSVSRGKLPAGQYGTLTFTGVENGVPGNAKLIDWISDADEDIDCVPTQAGDAFAGRIETLLTDPETQPDQRKWKIQVAIKIRDE